MLLDIARGVAIPDHLAAVVHRASGTVVVYPDSDMVWLWTDDEAVDLVVKRSSAEDDAAPWTTGTSEAER